MNSTRTGSSTFSGKSNNRESVKKNAPPLIALLTDFGTGDHYVAAMKGIILTINPDARIVDLSHEIAPQNVTEASFTLSAVYRCFPRGSIMVAVVDPGVGGSRRIICLEAGGYVFLAPDNGLLTPVARREKRRRIFLVTNRRYFRKEVSATFHGRDVFAPAAAHLSLGVRPEKLGRKTETMVELDLPAPMTSGGILTGEVIHVDRFGNLVTNVTREAFARFRKTRYGNTIAIEIAGTRIRGLSRTYTERAPGEPLAIIGSGGRLEISVNGGSARRVLNAGTGTPVRIDFATADGKRVTVAKKK